MSTLGFPVAVPKNGDDFDATPVSQCLVYLLQVMQSYDASNIQAGTLASAAFDTNTSPTSRFTEMFASFIVSGGLSSGFTLLAYTVPSISTAYFQSNGKRIINITGQSFTAAINSDSYVSVNSNSVIAVSAVANGAAQPSLPSADSQWLQRVVSNGTTITRIDDLRALTPFQGFAPVWSTPTYANGWIDYDAGGIAGYGGVRYWKDALGIVHLRGMAKTGTATAGTNMLTLPAGYRPGVITMFEVSSNDARASLDVKPDGTVLTRAGVSNAWVSFSNISFKAEL